MKVIILDTSAFIQGYNPGDTDTASFSVPLVRDELRNDYARIRFDNGIACGALVVKEAEKHYTEIVETTIIQLGESEVLSKTDKCILALGLQLADENYEPTIVTDDYSVQNIAKQLGLKYQGLATPGIQKKIEWEIYCPGCRKKFNKPQPTKKCKICGTQLKRKPKGN